jgi:hypothetical protein
MSTRALLRAIDEDDCPAIKRLLRSDPSLATSQIRHAQLFRTNIVHWIYVGDTPLHLAAAGHRVEIIRLLLAAGADPNSNLNHRRSTPLHYAADSSLRSKTWSAARQVETIRLLLEAGGKINAPDKNGATPLHRAVRTRGADAVKYLLDSGADALLKNRPGSTPFHLAVQNTGKSGSGSELAKAGQRQIIQEFLSRGISPRLKDGKGKTVLDCATSDWIRELLGAKS